MSPYLGYRKRGSPAHYR
jgi:hypothetical protein